MDLDNQRLRLMGVQPSATSPSVLLCKQFLLSYKKFKMFARSSAVFVLALPLLAAATALPRNPSQCNSGSLQCCESTQSPTSTSLTALFGLLGIVASTLDALVGVTCSPITVIGVSGTSCNQQAVCCTNTSFNGLVALGCTPINLNL